MRNDAFDARNFFSERVEPLKQHQFGLTAGGPLRRDRVFVFSTTRASVTPGGSPPRQPCRRRQNGGRLLRTGYAAAEYCRGWRAIPQQQDSGGGDQSRRAQRAGDGLLGNVSPSIYRETLIGQNDNDQTGARIDLSLSNRDQLFGRYSYSGGNNFNPVSVRGSDAPGFPTRDDFSTHSLNVSSTRILSSSLTNTVRGNFLRHKFFFDQRLNWTPPSAPASAGEPVHEIGQGPPFFNVSGYTPIGGAITGPRNTTQHVRAAGQRDVGPRQPPAEVRRRVRADEHRHVPGSRRTRSSYFPARSRPTMPLPICSSAHRSRSFKASATFPAR